MPGNLFNNQPHDPRYSTFYPPNNSSYNVPGNLSNKQPHDPRYSTFYLPNNSSYNVPGNTFNNQPHGPRLNSSNKHPHPQDTLIIEGVKYKVKTSLKLLL